MSSKFFSMLFYLPFHTHSVFRSSIISIFKHNQKVVSRLILVQTQSRDVYYSGCFILGRCVNFKLFVNQSRASKCLTDNMIRDLVSSCKLLFCSFVVRSRCLFLLLCTYIAILVLSSMLYCLFICNCSNRYRYVI